MISRRGVVASELQGPDPSSPEERLALLADEIRILRMLLTAERAELEWAEAEVRRLQAGAEQLDGILRSRSYRYLEPVRRLNRKLRSRVKAKPATGSEPTFAEVRKRVAARFLRGDGVEIGALHEPLQLPEGVSVRYVDRMSLEELRADYPELADRQLVVPDVIDDGESLSTFAASSVDFIVANHFIEHCQDPIGTLKRHLEVVREGGIVYLAVPDKRHTFDTARPVTTVEHLVGDHRDGPERSRWDHFLEFAIAVDGAGARWARELSERDYSIHFHVWTPEAFRSFVAHCRDELGLPFELAAFVPNDFEFIVVLRRVAQPLGATGRPASASTS